MSNENKPKVYIEQAENLTKDGIEAIKKITDIEKKPKIKQLPINYMVDEFANQQLTTLQDKSVTNPKNELSNSVSSDFPDENKKSNKEEKENANDANANGRTTS